MLNQEGFAALFDACHPRVYAYAVSRCGRRLSEEVVSETFVVAWRRRDDIPAKAALPWLLGVARNVIRDVHREELRRVALDDALHGWADETGPDVAEEVAERAAVLRALATLSDEDKEVLMLVSWHGLSSVEAAKVVGSSPVGLLRAAASRQAASGGGHGRLDGGTGSARAGIGGGAVKRKNVLDVLAAARPADLDPPGTPRAQVVELGAPVRGRQVRWVGAVVASLAMASVIAVLGVPRLLGHDTVTGQVTGRSAANVLDVAADRASGQQQVPGRYWHTVGLILGEQVIGSPDNRYRIKTRVQTSRWVPRGPEAYMLFTERGMPTVRASAANEQAWRRAGAPKLCGVDSDCGNDTAPLGRTRFMFRPSTWPIQDQGLTLSASELLDLPRDQDALKERLLSFWPAYGKTMAAWPSPPPGASLPTKESWLLSLSLDLLQNSPISAGTRLPSTGWWRVCPAPAPWARSGTPRGGWGSASDGEGRWGTGGARSSSLWTSRAAGCWHSSRS
ncbi:RNA polymerase sigma factor [Nonomuraea sp. NEAU-A123]|uniref:RNA polymerase sigma factor n=1 Tax=Nonomuraea sp. NEAU-A123 TaxID=2839649 RepID=UPI001BE3F2A5|nr:RNA polymerase sigma factor [Nonomuraea sp. NEAU-A123]MBT2229580.1 RNA polymerase sigma factor [Nonomuraea sp. NEAU-A123]